MNSSVYVSSFLLIILASIHILRPKNVLALVQYENGVIKHAGAREVCALGSSVGRTKISTTHKPFRETKILNLLSAETAFFVISLSPE